MSHRRSAIVFAIVASLLAVTAMPAVAIQTNTAVGSIHTNDSDFNAATELTNVSVVGAGTGASVDFQGDTNGTTATRTADDTTDSVSLSYGLIIQANNDLSGVRATVSSNVGVAGANPTRARLFTSGGSLLETETGSFGPGDKITFTTDLTAGNTYHLELDNSGSSYGLGYFDGSATDTSTDIDINGGSVNQGASSVTPNFASVTALFGNDNGTYISATHSVDKAEQGFTNLTLSNVTAHVTWLADTDDDGTFETTAASSNFTTTGNHTLDISGTTSTDWRVNVTFETNGTSAEAELHDEGVLFSANSPELDNASASPSGGTELTQRDVTLEIPVNDSDFSTAQGDSVSVEFFVDGVSEGTDTLTANGTASLETTVSQGGSHTWHATATDEYGNITTSQTFSLQIPSNITIREETEPHSVIKQATITVLISGSGETVDRQTVTDGNVSLVGLPTGEEYVVLVNASGYHPRAILVESIFEQNSVFVLNESVQSIENTFVIEDRSGNFPPSESKLLIQKPVNRSLYDGEAPTNYQWLTIGGDRLGADQSLTLSLMKNDRYRLVAQNEAGDERILGEYTAVNAGTIELRVGNVVVTPDSADSYAYTANYTNSSGTKYIKFQFNDPEDLTTDIELIIYEFGNETNEIENSTHTGPYGTFSFTKDLTAIGATAENTTWVVEFTATRGGESITGRSVVGRTTIGNSIPVAPMWLHLGSVGMLVLISGMVGGLVNPGAGGATIASVAGVLWHMDVLPPEIGGGAIALGLLVSAAWIVVSQGAFR